MNPLKRKFVSKSKSARHFRSHAASTKSANIAPPPMRGGYRF